MSLANTPNLNLYLPNRNDAVAVDTSLSSNFEIIDEAVSDLQNEVSAKAETFTYTVVISDEWTGSAAPYTQELTVVGILDTDTPFISVVYDADNEIAIEQHEAWQLISKAETEEDTLIFTCFEELPTVEIPIQIKVVR